VNSSRPIPSLNVSRKRPTCRHVPGIPHRRTISSCPAWGRFDSADRRALSTGRSASRSAHDASANMRHMLECRRLSSLETAWCASQVVLWPDICPQWPRWTRSIASFLFFPADPPARPPHGSMQLRLRQRPCEIRMPCGLAGLRETHMRDGPIAAPGPPGPRFFASTTEAYGHPQSPAIRARPGLIFCSGMWLPIDPQTGGSAGTANADRGGALHLPANLQACCSNPPASSLDPPRAGLHAP